MIGTGISGGNTRRVGLPPLRLLAFALLGLACATRDPAPAPVLAPNDLATRASEFFCAHGAWPEDAARLEAFPMPATPRTGLAAPSGPIPWALLGDATFAGEPDGALGVRADLPPGSVAGQPPERPVALRLRVEPPGCWPPRGAGEPVTGPRP